MKKLVLIRHAKSDWSDYSLDDFERPLNNRGLKNAPFMGKLLLKKAIKPDLILSSPAKRALSTAALITKSLGLNKKLIKEEISIYEATLNKLLKVLKNQDDKNDCIFLIGHNPSLNSLAYNLCSFDENIVTCAFLELELDINSWKEITKNKTKLISYEYPKKYK